jgi:hypothetical protein
LFYTHNLLQYYLQGIGKKLLYIFLYFSPLCQVNLWEVILPIDVLQKVQRTLEIVEKEPEQSYVQDIVIAMGLLRKNQVSLDFNLCQ